MTKLKITVTKEVLEKSKNCGKGDYREVITNCAVALAVRDIFPRASVVGPFLRFEVGKDDRAYLPKRVGRYIKKFDDTKPEHRPYLPEISFEIEIPDEIIEKINIEELRPLLTNHPTLELV
jgi:hypothetical protein